MLTAQWSNEKLVRRTSIAFVLLGVIIVLGAFFSLDGRTGYVDLYLLRALVYIGVGLVFELLGITLMLMSRK